MELLLFRALLVINALNIATENPVTTKPYRFPVYPVNECPRSKDEFKTAAQRRNCTKGLRYLCAPNKYLSSLIEFCTNRQIGLYQKGNCVILEGTGDLDHYSCVEKFNSSCPLEFYNDEEIYKYPACLEIDKELRCFAADNGCKKREFHTTKSNLNISKLETVGDETFRGASRGWLAIGYIIATAAVLAVIILSWIIFQKRKREQVERWKDNNENESLLKDNPEIDDDKLREFLCKGEITVCHVRCIIVGCGKAGKTTLLKRLQNVSFDELMQIERTEMVDFHVNSFEVLLEEETIKSVEKEDTLPTILFSKEKLEMPLRENDGKMAKGSYQPGTLQFYKGGNFKTTTTKGIKKQIVSEKSSLRKTTFGQIENIPMVILKNQANNGNAENEETLTFEPNSQDTTLVENHLSPKPNEKHGEDIGGNVNKIGFEQYAILKLKDVVNELLNETDLRPRITFLDFAGQSMYYAFHQIFLRPKSCSILVVDMTKSLDDKVGVQDENEKECSQFASWRYRDYYKFWLRSIDVFSDTESPVIIVGTHADKLSKEECRTFLESLFEFFDDWSHSDLRRHLNTDRMYTIGFPVSGSELEDLKDLKKCIANIVKCPCSKEPIRPVWALFEHILNKMKETEKVIPRKTLSDYIDQLSVQEFRIDESEISKMLVFFHRVGVLLYFDKDGLKEKIILDIQWLLDAFKCIIEYPVRTEVNDIKRRHFYRTGELDNVELDRIWHIQGKDFLKHKPTIIAYMQQLGLLIPLKELHSIDSTVYYFPSMNSKRFNKTGENNSKSSILCFKFDDENQLPINVFHGIVLKCSKLNNWSILTEGAKNNICLYQNAACFSFQKHVVVLCNCNFEIRVQVWASPEIYDGRLLKEIKHSVEDIIRGDDLSYKIGYKCRKDVLYVEEDVSFISQSTFPVSNHLCEICDVDKKHVVDNDICWELEVNGENQERIDMLEKTKVPLHVIEALDEMKARSVIHYASLVLLMAWQGPLSIDSLEDSKSSEKKDFERKKCKFLKACEVSSLTENFIFVNALLEMDGTYTVKNGKQINFIHESMFEIIAYHFGRHFPEVILENLNDDYIAKYIKIETSNSRKRKRDSEEETYQAVEDSDSVTEDNSVNDLCIKLKESQCPMLAKKWYNALGAGDLFSAFGNASLKHPYVYKPFIRIIEDEPYDMFHSVFFENLENKETDISLTVLDSIERNFKQNDAYFLLNGYMLINKNDVSSVKAISFVIYYGHHQILQCIIYRVNREKGNLDDLFENEYTKSSRLCYLDSDSDVDASADSNLEMRDNDEDCEDPGINTDVTDRDCDTDSDSETAWEPVSIEQIRLLCLGCHSGDLPTVQILLRHVDLNALDITDNPYKANNPLAIAIKLGHSKIAMELLKYRDDGDSDIFEYSPLIGACKYGHITIVKELIKNGNDINLKCERMNGGCITPLIIACQRGQLRVVEELIKLGANVNLAGKETPLTAACLNGHFDIVDILLKAGADINLGNGEKKTPLEIARERGHVEALNNLTGIIYSRV